MDNKTKEMFKEMKASMHKILELLEELKTCLPS